MDLTLPECEALLRTAVSIDVHGACTPAQSKLMTDAAVDAIVAVLTAVKRVADATAKS